MRAILTSSARSLSNFIIDFVIDSFENKSSLKLRKSSFVASNFYYQQLMSQWVIYFNFKQNFALLNILNRDNAIPTASVKESIAISKEERINLARYRAVSWRSPVRTNDFTVYQISFTFEALDLGFPAPFSSPLGSSQAFAFNAIENA